MERKCDFLVMSQRFFYDNLNKCLVTVKKLKAGASVGVPAFAGCGLDILNMNNVFYDGEFVMYFRNGLVMLGDCSYEIKVFNIHSRSIDWHTVTGIHVGDFSNYAWVHCDGIGYKIQIYYMFSKIFGNVKTQTINDLFRYKWKDFLSVGLTNRRYKFVYDNRIVYEGYFLMMEFWGIALDLNFNIAFICIWSMCLKHNRETFIIIQNIIANYASCVNKNRLLGELIL